jgi:hypothetical protein
MPAEESAAYALFRKELRKYWSYNLRAHIMLLAFEGAELRVRNCLAQRPSRYKHEGIGRATAHNQRGSAHMSDPRSGHRVVLA